MSASTEVAVTTPDGRLLEVLDTGPRDGLPLVFHHGTPQGAIPFGILERPAAERGLRVISGQDPRRPARPGAALATLSGDIEPGGTAPAGVVSRKHPCWRSSP
jgi:hypothetical protein